MAADQTASWRWDLTILFPDVSAWQQERTKLNEDIAQLHRHQGRVGESAEAAETVIRAVELVEQRVERLQEYAARLLDEDLTNTAAQGLVHVSTLVGTDFAEAVSFLDPEFLSLPAEQLKLYSQHERLQDYSVYFSDLVRMKDHVLDPAGEKLLSSATKMDGAYEAVHSILTTTDLPFPTFVDREGEEVRLDVVAFERYRHSTDRQERKEAFEKFWSTYQQFQNTFASILLGQVAYHDFESKARRFPNVLTSALHPWNIPSAFYSKLIEEVNQNLDSLQSYLLLRKRLLGIEGDQYYYDITASVAQGEAPHYEYREAVELVTAAMKPLGPRYEAILRTATAEHSGWLDVYPRQNRCVGEYCAGIYGGHPLVLLNYKNDYTSLTTLAHELGHAIHTEMSNQAQPYSKAEYSLVAAEVASTFNETLLAEYMLSQPLSTESRRVLLASYLDTFRTTVFRQALFAEFELQLYRNFTLGVPMMAEQLSDDYLKLLRRYCGHDDNVMVIDPLYGIEWAYVPHFYYCYYVYQYISGFVAATALAQRVLQQNGAAEQYIHGLLESGCSAPPLEQLRAAGVDMLDSEPYRLAFDLFRSRTKELECL